MIGHKRYMEWWNQWILVFEHLNCVTVLCFLSGQAFTAALGRLFTIRSSGVAFRHVPELIYGLPATKNFQPVQRQIHYMWTRLCLSWPKICYSWTRIWPFWRPKICYFLDKHKAELQGASYSCRQAKPTYFRAASIPILDMTGTPLEAHKCWETFI